MTNSKQYSSTKLQKIKKNCLFLLIGCIFVYYLWPKTEIDEKVCINDRVHNWTESENKRMNEDAGYRFWQIVIGQIFIDICFLVLISLYLFKIRNFFPLVWMLCFYLTRAFLLQISSMPYPKGIIWDHQGVPSFGVPYGIARDFFYSGHTGFMVMCVSLSFAFQSKFMKIFTFLGTLQVIYLLIVTRVHYSIDIFAGFVFSRWYTMLIIENQQKIDQIITLNCQKAFKFTMKSIQFAKGRKIKLPDREFQF